ncbi:MAG: hypothetical protein E7596_07800 [Ruminococcaceae bacterium]|nr:hypothetical protein [Oscillospiraceae bacterium]
MKKKILLLCVMVAVLACILAISVCAAEPSYKDGEWIYADDDVTKLAIRDTDGNPLIWYMNGEELKYVRADQTDATNDVYVVYNIGAGGSGFGSNSPQKTLKDIDIYDDGVKIECAGINSQLVLFNMEKLDIDALNGWLFGNKNGCCLLMRGIVFPSTLKYIGQEGLTNLKIVQYWNLENTQLEYINACNFCNAGTLTQEATNGVLRCPQTLDRPIEIQGSQIKTYIMNPYFDYDISVQWNQFFRNCKKLEKIICPSTVSMGFGPEAFRDTPTQYLVFIAGTQEDAQNTLDKTNGAHNSGFKAANIISYDEYLADKKTYDESTKQVYIVYGYNFCDAFYDGNHAVTGNETVVVKDFMSEISIGDFCTREECGEGVVTKTIAPIIKCLGTSVSQYKDVKGKYSITIEYKIDYNAYEEYLKYGTLEFGLVASAVSVTGNEPLAVENGKVVAKNAKKTIVAEQNKFKRDYVDFKLLGVTEEQNGKEFVLTMYTYDGKNISYLNGTVAVNVGNNQ